MKLSEARKQAIYNAVSTVIVDVRIELRKRAESLRGKLLSAEDTDALLFGAQDKAAQAAIAAATKVRRR